MSVNLNPEKALIFRIVHVDNVPWILDHDGLHCRNWPEQNPDYINIGNPELIDKRSRHRVPIPPDFLALRARPEDPGENDSFLVLLK